MEIEPLHEDEFVYVPEAFASWEVIDSRCHAVKADLVFQPASDGYMQNLGGFDAAMCARGA